MATVVLGSAGDAEDVVQAAAERMWRSIVALDADRGFRAWFLRGVANTARNHRRSWWRRNAVELRLVRQAPEAHVDEFDPADAAVSADDREMVIAALNRLDADTRLVIALRHFEQLGEREMAVVLGCATGTVKSRLSRAMQRLRVELGEDSP